jgi:hypothetical protein
MAEKYVIEIDANTKEAQKSIEKLTNNVDDLGKAQDKTADATKKIGKGISLLTGGAIIAVALKAFTAFTEVLSKNQRVADFFSVSLEAVSIAFNDLTNFIINNSGGVIDTFKAIFNDPVKAIKDLGTAIKDNIIERFTSMIETVGLAGKAIVSFVKGDFEEAGEFAKQAGKELVDVYTGVDNSVDKLAATYNKVKDSIVEYTTETLKTAKANIELIKTAEVATALNTGLLEQYDRQAEKLRQVRDEERNTLAERIQANEELSEVLNKQEAAMLANARAIQASAAAQFNKNDSQENYIALIESNNEVLAVQATIEGFRSEQLINNLGLSREQAELDKAAAETNIENSRTEQEADIALMENERLRFEATRALEMEQHEQRLELINSRLEAEKEGSTAYAEILNERSTLETGYNTTLKTLGKQTSDFLIDLKAKEEAAKLGIIGSALGGAMALAEQGSATYKALAVAQVLLDTFKGVQASFASNAANVGATTLSGGAWPFIQAAAAASFGAANIAGILAVNPKGGGSTSVSAPTGRAASINSSGPQFNTVAALQQNRLLNNISNSSSQPIRAYVVGSDVSTAQQIERNRVSSASF